MAIQLQPGEKDIKRIVDAVIQLGQGRMNSGGKVTLTPNATTTTVTYPNCSRDSNVHLTAQTANAAAALAGTYVSSVLQGSFVITHASAASTDRTFTFSCSGG